MTPILTIAKCVGGRGGGGCHHPYYSHHGAGDCHISAAPLWLRPPLPPAQRVWAAASGVQVHPEGVLGHRDNKSTSQVPTTVEDGTRMGPKEWALTPALPLSRPEVSGSHCPHASIPAPFLPMPGHCSKQKQAPASRRPARQSACVGG